MTVQRNISRADEDGMARILEDEVTQNVVPSKKTTRENVLSMDINNKCFITNLF